MRRLLIHGLCALVFTFTCSGPSAAEDASGGLLPYATSAPELEYLKAVNAAAIPRDPEILLLLMAQFANANRRAEGIEYFSDRLREFGPRVSDSQKALYLSAIGVLRAGSTSAIPIWKKLGWVNETIDILESARRLSGGQTFVVRWMSGVVYAQLPSVFLKRGSAHDDLTWCVEHAELAPHPGWLREVHFRLATLAAKDGIAATTKAHLQLTGITDLANPVFLTTPFSEDPETGHAFSAKRIVEIVPKRVYALSGYEFTEYYFVVSEDGRELIAIDAGTRPDSAQAAYEALKSRVPGLPELTTVLITHSHWDHIGGHRYFRSLNHQHVKFYARDNYQEEISKGNYAPGPVMRRFFGSRFNLANVKDFKPDVSISRNTVLGIGGTRFELLPVQGGETGDALFINLPDYGVTFVGDFIMPYLGAPFVNEGDLDGLLTSIDTLAEKKPKYVLHGHEPLTRLFSSPSMLVSLKAHLGWLRSQVLLAIRQGAERASIHQANLIPPGLLAGDPATYLPFLVLRENVINRVFQQNTGYWQADLQGIDYVSRADRGSMLVDYLGLSDRQLASAATKMIADGKHELAATLTAWARERLPASEPLKQVDQMANTKLMEKYSEFNPFKFIIYSGLAERRIPQMETGTTAGYSPPPVGLKK